MLVKYKWHPTTNDPKAINGVEVDQLVIPRLGEKVDIRIQITRDEFAEKHGTVKSVTHAIEREPYIWIFID
jgi:hypothetical protein